MNWGGWQAFLHMGGHGPFVWGSFGVVAVVLWAEHLTLRLSDRRARQALVRRWHDDDLEEGTA
jgi:heme exporter protein D